MNEEDNIKENNPEIPLNAEEQKIASLTEELAEANSRFLRLMADAENARKRFAKELRDAGDYSIGNFAHDMIEVLENLVRAIDSIPKESLEKDALAKNIHQGVEMTKTLMLNALEKNGIKRLNPINQEFDHNYHQALSHNVTKDAADGTVTQVIQAGYIIKDRLLRPALVIVAKSEG